jgi:hypothetical protein
MKNTMNNCNFYSGRHGLILILSLIAVPCLLVGCQNSDSEEEGYDDPTSIDDICDGSTSIRFSAVQWFSGQTYGGEQTLNENGTRYLIVDGQCRFFAYKKDNGGVGRIATGQLTENEINAFIRDFRLDEWSKWEGEYCSAQIYEYLLRDWDYAGRTISFRHCYPDKSSRFQWLKDGFDTNIEAYMSKGQPWDGDVRYFLVFAPESTHEDDVRYQNAPLWPLDVEPDTIAMSLWDAEMLGEEGADYLASGEDAEKLRQLRDSVVIGYGEIGIVDGAGRRYMLFHRDSIDLENEEGLLPYSWRD